jgi:DNA-binding NarL/FixJ family response regulator
VIDLFIICKNDLFFKIIAPVLEPSDIRIAAIVKTTYAAVQEYMKSKADIVILDANWNDEVPTGKETLAGLLANDPRCKVIVMNTFYEPVIEQEFIQLGASGYFYKNVASLDRIRECIQNTYHSDRVMEYCK